MSDIAEATGLSEATVSLALRKSPKIRPETAAKVLAAAERLGYRPSPLVAALMSRIRGARPVVEHTTLGILNLSPNADFKAFPAFYRTIVEGLRERARHHGFSTDVFHLHATGLAPARVNSILKARGIHGLLVPPFVGRLSELGLDLGELSAVVVGYAVLRPRLHRVCPDQSQTMMLALEHLHARGYRRLGLALDRVTDERVLHKWSALLHWHNAQPGVEPVPLLFDDGGPESCLVTWVKKRRPEVVISSRPEHLRLLRQAGVLVPEQVGFCLLNHSDRDEDCAGVDQRPGALGEAAVDALVAQLYRNERGVPAVPTTVMIEGEWVDGPTLRAPVA